MPLDLAPFRLGVVLLAAGRSSRMGRPKLLLPWGQSSVLGHLIETWHELGAEQIACVCAANDEPIAKELDRLRFPATDRIFNAAPERGMFSSIQCAARWQGWKPELTHWAVLLGDQPHLPLQTLCEILAFSAAHQQQICMPRQAGHRRHPVLLPSFQFRKLADTKCANLKEFLDSQPESLAFFETADPAFALDMDRPEDYETALRLFLRSHED